MGWKTEPYQVRKDISHAIIPVSPLQQALEGPPPQSMTWPPPAHAPPFLLLWLCLPHLTHLQVRQTQTCGNSIDNQGVWLKEVIKFWKKANNKEYYLNFALLPLHWAPQYPLPQAPLPPVLLHPPVPPISVISVLATHSEKRDKGGKSQSVMQEGAIAHSLEMVHNIPQVPNDHMVKCTHAS